MYKVALYATAGISGFALLLSATGVLGFPLPRMLASLAILIVVSYLSSRLLAWMYSTKSNPESWLITALILFLIIPPAGTVKAYIATALVALVASASKYFLVWNGRHIFNPVAVAVALLGLGGLISALWWVATPLLLPIVALSGFLLVVKTRRYVMVGTFLAVAIITSITVTLLMSRSMPESLSVLFLSGPLLFLATIMLTEPFTSPATRRGQIIYASIVGVCFSAQIPWLSLPASALLVGNVVAFWLNKRQSSVMSVVSSEQIGPSMHEIVLHPDKTISFKPGQYLELSLPHDTIDSKGMRRTFSISSSPSDPTIRIGFTHGAHISSFKKALLSEAPGPVRITQLGGDFTLPADTSVPLIFIAGGIGITPFRSMLADMIDRDEKRTITLYYGAKSIESIAYKDILDTSEKNNGVRIIPILSSPDKSWKGDTGHPRASLLHRYSPDFRESVIYISGPPVMVDTVKSQLKKRGVPNKNIRTDHFTGY